MLRRSPALVGALATILIAPSLALAVPHLPAVPSSMDASMPDTTGYNTYGPVAAADLQREIDSVGAATGGHSALDLTNGVIITVSAGTTTNHIQLRNKATAAGKWIVIRSSQHASLPPAGTRIAKSDAARMFKVTVPAGGIGVEADKPSSNYRIIGLEVTTADGNTARPVYYLAWIGAGATQPSQLPDNIVFDRVYFHGLAGAQNLRNGIALYTKRAAVVDSIIDEVWHRGAESHNIYMNDTTGPVLIQNNQISNATIGVLTGGAASRMGVDDAPYDVTIRRNYFLKDTAFRGARFVKNHIEFKRITRALIEQNCLFQLWTGDGDQNGSAMQFICFTEGGAAPNCRLDDVTVRWNWVRGAASGINASGEDVGSHVKEGAARLHVHDNLWDDMNRQAWDPIGGAVARGFMGVFNGYYDVTVDHNTVILAGANSGQAYWAAGLSTRMPGSAMTGFTFTNNLAQSRDYGWWSDGGETNVTVSLDKYYGAPPRPWRFKNNVIADGPANSGYPGGNFTEPVGPWQSAFADIVARHYQLKATSRWTGRGIDFNDHGDGTDIGVSSYPTFVTKLLGVQAGSPEGNRR